MTQASAGDDRCLLCYLAPAPAFTLTYYSAAARHVDSPRRQAKTKTGCFKNDVIELAAPLRQCVKSFFAVLSFSISFLSRTRDSKGSLCLLKKTIRSKKNVLSPLLWPRERWNPAIWCAGLVETREVESHVVCFAADFDGRSSGHFFQRVSTSDLVSRFVFSTSREAIPSWAGYSVRVSGSAVWLLEERRSTSWKAPCEGSERSRDSRTRSMRL